MNIKISKKRAAKILQEEVEKFINENENVDPKLLKDIEKKISVRLGWPKGAICKK